MDLIVVRVNGNIKGYFTKADDAANFVRTIDYDRSNPTALSSRYERVSPELIPLSTPIETEDGVYTSKVMGDPKLTVSINLRYLEDNLISFREGTLKTLLRATHWNKDFHTADYYENFDQYYLAGKMLAHL